MNYTNNMQSNTYKIDRIDARLYKGFKLLVTDYRNLILNKVVREVVVTPISVPQDVYLMFYRRVSEQSRANRFDTLREAKGLIDSCYRACSYKTVRTNKGEYVRK